MPESKKAEAWRLLLPLAVRARALKNKPMKPPRATFWALLFAAGTALQASTGVWAQMRAGPVDWVNPTIGNISHLLVPTFPTVHLPNSMLRVVPERGDFTSARIGGLPLLLTGHCGASVFSLSRSRAARATFSRE